MEKSHLSLRNALQVSAASTIPVFVLLNLNGTGFFYGFESVGLISGSVAALTFVTGLLRA
ncbi:hypothetical protein [Limnobacter sp.]|uniref:hypothetical protein n=1 Tax=Limnobacter sp. TaxID=2003368 RepID=UPI00258F3D80|nr:hypothetical protein [Limnobacter sp.]